MDSEGQTILESPGYLAALYFSEEGNHYGSRAFLNSWNPQVLDNQFSSFRVVLWSWDDKVQPVTAVTNLIKAGWAVHPRLYGDNKTRLMTTWTDRDTGNWWLFLGESSETPIGYWPKELFTTLSDSARRILWAGETYHSPDSFSSPPMGSGHFPDEGWSKAAFISQIQIVNEDHSFEGAVHFHIEKQVDAEKCYDVRAKIGKFGKGFGFFVGGPGGDCN